MSSASTGGATAVLEGWRGTGADSCAARGKLDVFHLDAYSQALSKLERAFDQDLDDVRAMLDRGLVEPQQALHLFGVIESELFRYPAIDPISFRARVERAFSSHPGGHRFEPA